MKVPTNAELFYYILRRFPCGLSGDMLDRYCAAMAQVSEVRIRAIEDMKRMRDEDS